MRTAKNILARYGDHATPDTFIFPSSRGTAINTNNFLFRVLKEAGRNAGIESVTHQMLRRTCSTYMAQITSVEDVRAHLRHLNAKTRCNTTSNRCLRAGRAAVESLDQLLNRNPSGSETPAN